MIYLCMYDNHEGGYPNPSYIHESFIPSIFFNTYKSPKTKYE